MPRPLMMQAPLHPWLSSDCLHGRPTVGALMGLCEENFALLLRLVPDLRCLRGSYRAQRAGDLDLHLEVLDQSPYTTTARLTYVFAAGNRAARHDSEPDALLRIYHDARQVEILGLSPKSLPVLNDVSEPLLLDKWRINLFLAKWLEYCLRQGYRFCAETEDGECSRGPDAISPVPLAVCP